MSLGVPEEYPHADLFGALRDPLSFIVSVTASISIHHWHCFRISVNDYRLFLMGLGRLFHGTGITFEEQIDPSVFQCY